MGIGKQNNSKCNQEEGFGIFGTADEKSQFWKGKNLHVYIYIHTYLGIAQSLFYTGYIVYSFL